MRELNRVARCWQIVCHESRLVIELDETEAESTSRMARDFSKLDSQKGSMKVKSMDEIEVEWLEFEKEAAFTVRLEDDDEVKLRFDEKICYRKTETICMAGDDRPMKKDKTTKMDNSWIPDLRKIAGLFYFIIILLGVIEFIPRPDITWIWILVPIFWVRETAKREVQHDA